MTAFHIVNKVRWFTFGCGVTGVALITMLAFWLPSAQAQRGKPVEADSVSSAIDMHRDDCMHSIRDIYGHLITPPPDDSVGVYKCRVEVIPKDSTRLKHSVTDLDIMSGVYRLRVTSEVFSIDRDSVDVFAVVHGTGTVFRSDARASSPQFGPALDLAAVRDSLIARSLITSCEEMIDSSHHNIRIVRLSPDPYARRLYDMSEITMVLDLDLRQVRSMTVIPYADRQIAKLIWTFSPYTVEPESEEFRYPVATRFLIDDRTLNSEWRSFRLVDNRHPIITAER